MKSGSVVSKDRSDALELIQQRLVGPSRRIVVSERTRIRCRIP